MYTYIYICIYIYIYILYIYRKIISYLRNFHPLRPKIASGRNKLSRDCVKLYAKELFLS